MENKEKKVAIVVIALAVLLIGASFGTYAFFTYNMTGNTPNKIVSGRVSMNFTEGGSAINITNQFPLSVTEAKDLTTNTSFTITGESGEGYSLSYNVFAIADNIEGTRLKDEDVSIYLTNVEPTNGSITINSGYNQNTVDIYGNTVKAGLENSSEVLGGEDGNKCLLASGILAETMTTHSYTLKMWINNSVTISDTDTEADYCASSECENEKTNFKDTYYAIKLRVESNEHAYIAD